VPEAVVQQSGLTEEKTDHGGGGDVEGPSFGEQSAPQAAEGSRFPKPWGWSSRVWGVANGVTGGAATNAAPAEPSAASQGGSFSSWSQGWRPWGQNTADDASEAQAMPETGTRSWDWSSGSWGDSAGSGASSAATPLGWSGQGWGGGGGRSGTWGQQPAVPDDSGAAKPWGGRSWHGQSGCGNGACGGGSDLGGVGDVGGGGCGEEHVQNERILGQVKEWHGQKGFGIVSCLDAEYFLHHSSILGEGFKDLVEGEQVEFELGPHPTTGRLQAAKVTGLDGASLCGRGKGRGKGKDEYGERQHAVFVIGLTPSVTDDDLWGHFSQAGEVVWARVALDRETRLSRGFGKVFFVAPEQASAAIEQLNGSDLGGSSITVRQDSPPGEGGARGGVGGGGPRGQRPNTVFVASLAPWTTEDELRAHFEQVGEVVDSFVALDRGTRQSRGFGKVSFALPEQMQAAMETLNCSELGGRSIAVRENNPEGGPRVGGGAPRGPKPNTVFVAGLPPSVGEEEMRAFFSQAGDVVDVYVALERETRRPRGFGKVSFASQEQMQEALEKLNGAELGGQQLTVREDNPPASRGEAGDVGQPRGPKEPRPNSVFVSGLAPSTTEEELREHFGQVGEVLDAYVAVERETRKSRGFGKVSFASWEQLQAALETLNGSELGGREISVREDHPLGQRSSGQGEAGGGGAPREQQRQNSIFVAGLSWSTSEEELRSHFEQAGEVVHAYVAVDRETRKSRGFGKVSFATAEQMQTALETLHGSDLGGREITVRADNPPPPRPEP